MKKTEPSVAVDEGVAAAEESLDVGLRQFA